MPGKNRIMIYGPKNDGTYVVEFKTAEGLSERKAARELKIKFSSFVKSAQRQKSARNKTLLFFAPRTRTDSDFRLAPGSLIFNHHHTGTALPWWPRLRRP
jgi:hypothetical protein